MNIALIKEYARRLGYDADADYEEILEATRKAYRDLKAKEAAPETPTPKTE